MITGLAHTAMCVPDLDAAVRWYVETLGLELLMPPVEMRGPEIEADMGELIAGPVRLRGAILGLPSGEDRVLELLEYPDTRRAAPTHAVTDPGFTHLGLLCDDIEKTRAELEAKGVEFLTRGSADIVGLRTTWFRDPWGAIFILLQKSRPERPYYRQRT